MAQIDIFLGERVPSYAVVSDQSYRYNFRYRLSPSLADLPGAEIAALRVSYGVGLRDFSCEVVLKGVSGALDLLDSYDLIVLGLDGNILGAFDLFNGDAHRLGGGIVSLVGRADAYMESFTYDLSEQWGDFLDATHGIIPAPVSSEPARSMPPYAYWFARMAQYDMPPASIIERISAECSTLEQTQQRLNELGFRLELDPRVIEFSFGELSVERGDLAIRIRPLYPLSERYETSAVAYVKDDAGDLTSITRSGRGATGAASVRELALDRIAENPRWRLPDAWNHHGSYIDRRIECATRAGLTQQVILAAVPSSSNPADATWKMPPIRVDENVLGTVEGINAMDVIRWGLQNTEVSTTIEYLPDAYEPFGVNEVIKLPAGVFEDAYLDEKMWRVSGHEVSYDADSGLMQSLELWLYNGGYGFAQSQFDVALPPPPPRKDAIEIVIEIAPDVMADGETAEVKVRTRYDAPADQDYTITLSIAPASSNDVDIATLAPDAPESETFTLAKGEKQAQTQAQEDVLEFVTVAGAVGDDSGSSVRFSATATPAPSRPIPDAALTVYPSTI